MSSQLAALRQWVGEVARLTQPDRIHWCDGSDEENQLLIQLMLERGDLIKLNQETHPNCYLHRSHPQDVARVEHLTYVAMQNEQDAGPNNHWMDPIDAHRAVDTLLRGSMRGRTMYVIPYCMGPLDSPWARGGVEITDSPYVVVNMRIMTRMGAQAQLRIEADGIFVKGVHSTADLNPQKRLIMHFPEELTIKSVGSGYGGNALLGKKCHALRIASWQARQEGWLAEHMLIMGVQNPAGETHYIAAAFPSACGKTNLAMLIPPQAYREKGWKIWTVGDDICWIHPGEDGRLYAINPESGFFGVAPGTSQLTNPNALAMLNQDTIFTNVALTLDGQPWWEGLDERVPAFDWQGRPFQRSNGPAAHPNARFTVAAKRCPSASPEMNKPEGVPLSAIIFGGRREALVPLVLEAHDWRHGVLLGAAMASETTAAAAGAIGIVRRDSMAMKPFCGYNFGDYFAHWLSFADRRLKLPKIFHVNWFRKGSDGKFLWPGFGDNMRVLEWILQRCNNTVGAVDAPIGLLPNPGDLNLEGLSLSNAALEQLLRVDLTAWRREYESLGQYLDDFGARLPSGLVVEYQKIRTALLDSDIECAAMRLPALT
jgi:phosphoenolpyruvate carboxykinase (GTP)